MNMNPLLFPRSPWFCYSTSHVTSMAVALLCICEHGRRAWGKKRCRVKSRAYIYTLCINIWKWTGVKWIAVTVFSAMCISCIILASLTHHSTQNRPPFTRKNTQALFHCEVNVKFRQFIISINGCQSSWKKPLSESNCWDLQSPKKVRQTATKPLCFSPMYM